MAKPRKNPKDLKKRGRKKTPLEKRLAARKLTFEMIARMAEEINSDAQIARILGVRTDTIGDWCRENPKFAEALKEGKAIADSKVEAELYKGAIGFEHEETHTEISDIIDNEGKATGLRSRKVKKIRRYHPGEAVKQIFWLKNRQPDIWKDRHDVGFDPTNPVKILVEYADGPAAQTP